MSGDVQPRKRKDKKRKKDELGLEEPRGTAAVLGEGDVFIHSYHEHGTGGHWCAKIIFFSLLAVLVTLIGLIILENRGLSELEANSVESRYSGVLEGWIDDAPEDDHHDEHTLELKHPDDHAEDEDDDDSEEVEPIEREVSDEDILSSEVPVLEEIKDPTSDDADQSEEDVNENDERSVEDDEPPVERITLPPAGKPYTEIEEETLQKTPDTLAEEEEYEKQQEELRRERQEQSSQGMWLKLVIGGALLVATHAVLRRATAPRDEPDTEEEIIREEPSVIERRMTLIPKTQETPEITQRMSTPSQEEIIKHTVSVIQSVPVLNTEDNVQNQSIINKEIEENIKENDDEKELYSDEDEEEEEEDVEEEAILIISEAKDIQSPPVSTPVVEESPDEDEDVEIIDEEQIEEELEDEEDEVEEEISDVDDTELLSRLEAKYGRLPEPERPGKNKGGGNSIEEDWPGEPSDPFWSQQLDLAEEELRQGWLE